LHTIFAWFFKSGFTFPSKDTLQVDLLDVKLMEETFRYIFSLIDLGNQGKASNEILQTRTQKTLSSEYGSQSYSKFYDLQQSAFITSSGVSVIGDTLRKLNAGLDANQPYSIYPIPHKDTFHPTNGGGVLLGISKPCEKRTEVFQLAHAMMEPDFLEAWVLASGNMPVFEHELWDKYGSNPLIASLKTEIASSQSYPFHPLWRNIEAILVKGISTLFWEFKMNRINTYQIADQINAMNQKINELIYLTWNRR